MWAQCGALLWWRTLGIQQEFKWSTQPWPAKLSRRQKFCQIFPYFAPGFWRIWQIIIVFATTINGQLHLPFFRFFLRFSEMSSQSFRITSNVICNATDGHGISRNTIKKLKSHLLIFIEPKKLNYISVALEPFQTDLIWFLDAIASPCSWCCQWVSEWVSHW